MAVEDEETSVSSALKSSRDVTRASARESDETSVQERGPLSSVQPPPLAMFRFTRPVLSAVAKRSTGITGLNVHPNPLPELKKTYEATLQTLSAIPQASVYRQGAESLTLHKLKIIEKANGDVSAAEKELDEGQIEESLDIAQDELSLANKMLEWKAYVLLVWLCVSVTFISREIDGSP